METLKDLRLALRSLRRAPGTSAAIVLTLALCVAAAGSIYAVAEALLLELLPYEAYEELVYVGVSFPTRGVRQIRIADPEYFDLVRQDGVFRQVAALENRNVRLTGGDRPERIRAQAITTNALRMLGAEPSRGRDFLASEQGPDAPRVALVSYRLWKERFGGRALVGRTIVLDDEPYQVIGIMPRGFRFGRADAWIPSRVDRGDTDRSDRWIITMARLRPGETFQGARARLAALADRLERRFGAARAEYRDFDFIVQPVYRTILRNLDTSILVLLGSVGLLLLIASANIGNLMAARYSARQGEMAIRAALGAGRWRLSRQILLESSSLGLLGGALGALLTVGSVGALTRLIPARYVPSETHISVDFRVILFALGAALLASLLFGSVPLWQTLRPGLALSLQEGGRGSPGGARDRRLRNGLVILECGLAISLLITAGVLVRSYRSLQRLDLGFDPLHVVRTRIALPESRYPGAGPVASFYQEILRELRSDAGVRACSLASSLPLDSSPRRAFTVAGRDLEGTGPVSAAVERIVSGGYFETLGIPVLAGRTFDSRDAPGRRGVVVVNETLADRHWPRQSAIGRQIRLGEPGQDGPVLEVIGVVGDTHQQSDLEAAVGPEVYLPFRQHAERARDLALLLRTSFSPDSVTELVRQEVLALDPQQPIYDPGTMEDLVEESVAPQRFAVLLLIGFSGLALVLAVLGLHALVAFSVRRRRRELALRLALGAERRDLRRLVLIQSLRLLGLGTALGMAGALVSGRLVAGLIHGVSPWDPAVFVGIPLLFVLVVLAASLLPAREATRVEPAGALRGDRD